MPNVNGKVAAAILGLPALALVLAAMVLLLKDSGTAPITIAVPNSQASNAAASTQPEIRVHVSGAVAFPDVYRMSPDDRVLDAITAAGGPASDADLTGINLARRVRDEDHYHIPVVGEEIAASTASVSSPGTGPTSASGPIDLNRASAEQLQELPGIGPMLSAAIVEYREGHGPFATVDQIVEVSGIGPKTLAGIRDLVTVTGTP